MVHSEKIRVLVIDDELTQRMLVKEYLEAAGHQVAVTEDGKRGLKLAISTKPDIILLDYLLPSVDGNSVCKNLKANPATADIPVILVTGSREVDVIEKGLAAGAEDFITKPVHWAYLADRVVHVYRKAVEKLELTRRLQQQSQRDPQRSGARRELDSNLEDLMREAEIKVERANGALQAERERLEAEHAEAMQRARHEIRAEIEAELAEGLARAREEIRAEVEAEFAAARDRAADEFQAAMERHRSETEAELAALRAEHARELDEASLQIGSDWSAKLEAARSEMSEAVARAEAAVHRQWHEDVAALKEEHSAELGALAKRIEIEAGAVRATVQRDKLVAERRHSAELGELREALEVAIANANASSQAAEAAMADAAAHTKAAWSLSARAAAAQADLASALAVKSSMAVARLGSSELAEVDRFVRALKSLTTHFKILAQAMAGLDETTETAVNLSALLGDIAAQAGRVAGNRRVTLHCHPVDPSITVDADEHRLRYALMCLVTNAIRFTPAGGAVALNATRDQEGTIRISVEDNGLGIAPAKLEELRGCLDMPAQTGRGSGTENAGLGIPTAHALARRMAGALELDSEIGGGTRAELVFPASRYQGSENRAALAG